MINVSYPGIRKALQSLPFAPYNLKPTSAERLVELAEHHYKLAVYYCHLAEEVRS